MPRPRDIVMKKLDPKELHSSALRRTVKLYSPFEVMDAELVVPDGAGYAVVYVAPLGGDRYVAATRSKKANALKLRDLLNDAWARGYYSSGREKGS